MKRFLSLLLIVVMAACSQSNYETIISTENDVRPTLIRNVNIFNGRDNVVTENQDVLIQEGVIFAISDKINVEDRFKVIDGKGKTLMPGLIDAHVHLSGSGAVPWEEVKADVEYNLQAYLYCGITTVYDLGGLAGDISDIAEEVASGKVVGPSVYNTHIPITVKNGHPIPLTKIMLPWPLKHFVNLLAPTIEDPSEAPELIESYVSNDIDYVKIICDQIPPGSPEINFEQLHALISESHQVGKKAFVHIGSPENAVNAIKAGADVLAHGVWRGELSEEQADYIARSGVPIIYTASGFVNVAAIHHSEFEPGVMSEKLVHSTILDPVTLGKGKDVHSQEVMNAFFEDVSNQLPFLKSNFQRLHKKGVPILLGTDSNLPGTYAGATYFQEIDVLKSYGMSNFEILSGATYLNAKAFLDDPQFGLVSEGKKADLLLLDGNPLVDIDFVKKPDLIFKSGRIINKLK